MSKIYEDEKVLTDTSTVIKEDQHVLINGKIYQMSKDRTLLELVRDFSKHSGICPAKLTITTCSQERLRDHNAGNREIHASTNETAGLGFNPTANFVFENP